MKWSMDTHKFMSEITRKALQIMMARGITRKSDPEEIYAVERELADAGIYGSYEAAQGRVRRALFTYFKSYGCLDDNEHLTEIGRLFVENKITVQEICFHYILNYKYSDDDANYYPVQLLLTCMNKLATRGAGQGYLSAYDFAQIVECQSMEQIDDAFIDTLITARQNTPIEVNERAVGFDVWSNMLISAGIVKKTTDKTLIVTDQQLADWILEAYKKPLTSVKGRVLTGVFEFLPFPQLSNSVGDAEPYMHEGKALQAYLFDDIENRVIDKYIFKSSGSKTFYDMIETLGLSINGKSFYSHFTGLEHLIGFCLSDNTQQNIKIIGSILASVELTETELTQIVYQEVCVNHDLDERISGGKNILIYGVPGSGKSWTIEHEYCHEGISVERLVFHPEYTNADFVGQILPVVDADKQVTYEFTPGPFTTVLKEAYSHPLREIVLIIEEINRGNAPAIFGEIFQLLDRTVEPKTVDGIVYPAGTSEYGITHKYMAERIYGNPTHKVRIPSNLSIVGTMNTSDQNVFTLDTAFQRRWRMRLIENNFDNVRSSLANAQILDTDVTWKTFCERVNSIIVDNKAKMASAEDKRLGVYFVHERDMTFDQRAVPSEGYTSLLAEYNDLLRTEDSGDMSEEKKQRLAIIREALMHNRMFPEKVIKYLWDDAFKFNPEALFDTDNMGSLEQVIRTFVYSIGHERFKIFKPNVRASLYPDSQA